MRESGSLQMTSPAWREPVAARSGLSRARFWRAAVGILGLFWIVGLLAIIG